MRACAQLQSANYRTDFGRPAFGLCISYEQHQFHLDTCDSWFSERTTKTNNIFAAVTIRYKERKQRKQLVITIKMMINKKTSHHN